MRSVSPLIVLAIGACFAGCPPQDVEGGWVEVVNADVDSIDYVEIVYGGPLVDSFRELHDFRGTNDKIPPGASRTFRLRFDGLYQVNAHFEVGGTDFNDLNTYIENGITIVLQANND